jgi:hypothetical protein
MSKPAKRPSARRFRVCDACERDLGNEGPRPADSELRLVNGEMKFACSTECSRSLGWRLF